MVITSALIEQCMRRAARTKLHPKQLEARLGEEGRVVKPKQRRARLNTLLDQMGDPLLAQQTLERLIGGNDLMGVNYLEAGVRTARSVCRIHLRTASGQTVGFGTGFLVAPGVVMTNHHVISSANEARFALAEFDYELGLGGDTKPTVTFQVLATPSPLAELELDFCLAKIAPTSVEGGRPIEAFGWLPLDPTPGKAFVGEYLTIIQHPGGERKQVCVRENKLIRMEDDEATLWYATDTLGGSSGSPVFNNSWQVVALHHSGVPKTNAQGQWLTLDGTVWDSSMDESRVHWIANEGIRISRILAFLQANHSTHPLAAATLAPPPPPTESTHAGGRSADLGRSELVDGELRVTVPVQIAVRVGDRPALSADTNGAPVPATPPVSSSVTDSSIESVQVDHSNINQRPGYDPSFLGNGFKVPLPKLSSTQLSRATKRIDGNGVELKYWNYSVVMCKPRKLGFFSAVNVDAKTKRAKRDGDRWFFDPRIREEDQLGPEFYGEQRTFEVDRSKNPFDRGHLSRRWDTQWAQPTKFGKRNGDDSFHWTNCSPQYWSFNQGARRWNGLEEYVIDNFAGASQRVSVVNGPIFDAPRSKTSGPRVVPNLTGARRPDPKFGGVAIPKMFFKIVAFERADKLAAAAFLMSQEDFLERTGRIHGLDELSDQEARLYQVRVLDVERLSGLDFGKLATADAFESTGDGEPRPIESIEEIRG